MARRKGSIGSFRGELVSKSREAALAAIRVFNDPATTFKSESFIVLMTIAWTYLLHAYFRSKRIEYRYFSRHGNRRVFDRTTTNRFKYWELERCLNDASSPVDKDAANNLRFVIGLRHEIEHQMTRSLDNFLSARYQACALNYNEHLKRLFGRRHGIEAQLTYSIQFVQLAEEQVSGPLPAADIPASLLAYVVAFDAGLTHEEFNNPRYAYRLLFHKRLVNRPGQADRVIEFIDPNSDAAKAIDKAYWVKKEVERKKFLAKSVVKAVQDAGFKKFRVCPEHLEFWKSENAKAEGKGFGALVEGSWYWYESWVDRCIARCQSAGDRYR